jgi:hypothetical protein
MERPEDWPSGDTYLLVLENVKIEVTLQVFVGVVDAELFETVAFEIFKTENVQHTDGNLL